MIHDLFGRGLSLGRSQNPQQLQHYVLQFFWHPILMKIVCYLLGQSEFGVMIYKKVHGVHELAQPTTPTKDSVKYCWLNIRVSMLLSGAY